MIAAAGLGSLPVDRSSMPVRGCKWRRGCRLPHPKARPVRKALPSCDGAGGPQAGNRRSLAPDPERGPGPGRATSTRGTGRCNRAATARVDHHHGDHVATGTCGTSLQRPSVQARNLKINLHSRASHGAAHSRRLPGHAPRPRGSVSFEVAWRPPHAASGSPSPSAAPSLSCRPSRHALASAPR